MKKCLKICSLALVAVFIAALVLSGCVVKTAESEKAGESGASGTTKETASPFDKKLEISWLIAFDASAYKEGGKVEQELEKRFNVDLKVIPINSMDNEKFYATIASGTIPDVIVRWESAKLYNDGIVRAITKDMILRYMPKTYEAIEQLGGKAAWDSFTSPVDGKLFAVPQIAANGRARLVLAARKDWMNNLGITAMPKTIDDIYNLAKAFTFNDPDKDGKNNTYGLGGAGMHPNPMFWEFQTIFGAYGVHPQYWIEEDGKVVYGAVANSYKEALKTLNKWYKEGILDNEKDYMNKHYYEKITLELLANIVYMNPAYFSVYFKQKTGLNYTEYITMMRIEKAKELLHDKGYRIYEIANMVGYDDFRYFSRIFKKVTGMNPRKYRNLV